MLISSIERFNKLPHPFLRYRGSEFFFFIYHMRAQNTSRGQKLSWRERERRRKMQVVETREGRIRLEGGDIDRWRYYVLNAYANSTQNSNYRFIVTSGIGSRANVSRRSNPTRAFSHEKLARNVHFWCVREKNLCLRESETRGSIHSSSSSRMNLHSFKRSLFKYSFISAFRISS